MQIWNIYVQEEIRKKITDVLQAELYDRVRPKAESFHRNAFHLPANRPPDW